jgi:hypothetical protein
MIGQLLDGFKNEFTMVLVWKMHQTLNKSDKSVRHSDALNPNNYIRMVSPVRVFHASFVLSRQWERWGRFSANVFSGGALLI